MTLGNDTLPQVFQMNQGTKTDTEFERVKRRAIEVFSNEGKADRWLLRESPALENKRPVDLIGTPEGRELVEAELMRIESGTY